LIIPGQESLGRSHGQILLQTRLIGWWHCAFIVGQLQEPNLWATRYHVFQQNPPQECGHILKQETDDMGYQALNKFETNNDLIRNLTFLWDPSV